MPLVPIKDIGKSGIVKDTEPALLAENAFTDGNNVRFRNGSVERMDGETLLHKVTLSGSPLNFDHYQQWRRYDTVGNFVAKGKKIYWLTYDQVSPSNSVPAVVKYDSANTLTDYVDWMFDFFGGGFAMIANNSQEAPVYCLYKPTDGGTPTNFVTFPGWDWQTGYKIYAKTIRPYRNNLVAGGITTKKISDGSVLVAPVTIRISTSAPSGSFPQTWKPGAGTDTADEFEINASTPIEDMMTLRDSLFIYCGDSIHQLSISNGIAQVRPYAPEKGILGQGCVVAFDNKHFVVARDDIYIHNGSGELKSVAQGRVRDFFQQDLDSTYVEYTRVIANPRHKEIWICYPRKGTTDGRFDRALIWNYADDTWTMRDLPRCRSISASDTINTIPGTPDFRYYTLNGPPDLCMAFSFDRIYKVDSGSTMLVPTNIGSSWETKSIDAYIQRDKLFSGDIFSEVYTSAFAPVIRVVPESGVSPTLSLVVSGQNVYDATPSYSNSSGRDGFTITPANTTHGYKMEPRQVGRFLNWKLSGVGKWILSHVGLEMKPAGKR